MCNTIEDFSYYSIVPLGSDGVGQCPSKMAQTWTSKDIVPMSKDNCPN